MGLSPRVRGNHHLRPHSQPAARSIPACAGEPPAKAGGRRRPGVYPRVCGGTLLSGGAGAVRPGLSPRVRGNQVGQNAGQLGDRSIPACAGEPPGRGRGWRRGGVYPRVCGGTLRSAGRDPLGEGLSPRVRGNPSSTPPLATAAPTSPVGLSPRVRGNPAAVTGPRRPAGSIPACAGEPWRRCSGFRPCRVYPRVCGGTGFKSGVGGGVEGLSPRVRGNPIPPLPPLTAGRSIPACAGEPATSPAL